MSGREASLGPALTQLLRGEQASWPRTLAAEEILERRDGAAALVVAWSAVLTRRVHDGRAEDQVEVLLPDGSSFDLARAESLLADKELERLYPPLRQPLNKATRPFRRFAEQRFELIQAIAFDDDIIADDDKKRLADFLDSTIGEMTACRELLASLGGVELGDQEAVTRGLDLPAPALFAATQLLALVRQALPALPARSLGVQRVSAPRRFTGHVVVDDADGADGTVRLWTAPCVTAGRFLAAARGAGRMLALAAHAPRHAPGLGLAVIDLDSRRALQESMGDARRAVQICVATSFLLARAHSAVALVGLRGLARDEEEEETPWALTGAQTSAVSCSCHPCLMELPCAHRGAPFCSKPTLSSTSRHPGWGCARPSTLGSCCVVAASVRCVSCRRLSWMLPRLGGSCSASFCKGEVITTTTSDKPWGSSGRTSCKRHMVFTGASAGSTAATTLLWCTPQSDP